MSHHPAARNVVSHTGGYTHNAPSPTPVFTSRVEPHVTRSGGAKKKKQKSSQVKRSPKTHRSKQKNGWETFFCMNGSQEFSKQVDSILPSWFANSPKTTRRGGDRPLEGFDQIRLYDGTLHSLEDEYGDWDLMQGLDMRGPERKGPERKSSVDLDIHVRDLFPCLGDVFDFCGCSKKKKQRARIMPRSAGTGQKHPQIETVCLECGHVLDHQQLGKSVLRDATGHVHWAQGVDSDKGPCIHRPNQFRRKGLSSKFDYGYGETPREWERRSSYEGYEGWHWAEEADTTSSGGSSPRHRRRRGLSVEKKVPLPQFDAQHPRKFRSRPGGSRADPKNIARWADSDYFDVDPTGHITLPKFGKL